MSKIKRSKPEPKDIVIDLMQEPDFDDDEPIDTKFTEEEASDHEEPDED